MAWTAGHVATDDVVVPLTQAAYAAAARHGTTVLPGEPAFLLGDRASGGEIWCDAVRKAETIRAWLVERVRGRTPPDHLDARVDRMILAGWCKETSHLTGFFQHLRDLAPRCRTLLLPPPDGSLAETLVDAALTELPFRCVREAGPIRARPDAARARFLGPPIQTGPVGVVVAFGLADPIAAALRLRERFPGPVLIVAEPAHAQAERLLAWLASAHERWGAVSVLALGRGTDLDGKVYPDFPSLARLLAGSVWPDRVRWTRDIDCTLHAVPIAWCVHSDHLSVAGARLLERTRRDGGQYWMHAHSAWPLRTEFAVPGSAGTGRVTVWTRPAAAAIMADVTVPASATIAVDPPARFRPLHRRPRQWLRRRARDARSLMRSEPLTVGVFLTSGQALFAPDGPMPGLVEVLRRLVRDGGGAGWSFDVRLRAEEDEPDVWRSLLVDAGAARLPRLRFHRVLGRSMADFLSACDVALEAGSETSAVLSAIAMGVPALRLDVPGWSGTRPARGDLHIPSLSPTAPYDDLCRLAGRIGDRVRLRRAQSACV